MLVKLLCSSRAATRMESAKMTVSCLYACLTSGAAPRRLVLKGTRFVLSARRLVCIRIVASEGVGSSPVGHPPTQVDTHRMRVLRRLPNASSHPGEQRTQGRLRCYSVLLRESRRTSR